MGSTPSSTHPHAPPPHHPHLYSYDSCATTRLRSASTLRRRLLTTTATAR